jgi:hypothetical protein
MSESGEFEMLSDMLPARDGRANWATLKATVTELGPGLGVRSLCGRLGVPPATYYRQRRPKLLRPWSRRCTQHCWTRASMRSPNRPCIASSRRSAKFASDTRSGAIPYTPHLNSWPPHRNQLEPLRYRLHGCPRRIHPAPGAADRHQL